VDVDVYGELLHRAGHGTTLQYSSARATGQRVADEFGVPLLG
jgi:hypothetical protein